MLLHLEQSESVFGHTQTNTWISTIIIGYQLSGMIIPKGGPLNKVIHDNSVIFPCFFWGLHIPVDERMMNYPKSWWTVGILFGSFSSRYRAIHWWIVRPPSLSSWVWAWQDASATDLYLKLTKAEKVPRVMEKDMFFCPNFCRYHCRWVNLIGFNRLMLQVRNFLRNRDSIPTTRMESISIGRPFVDREMNL